MPDITNPIAVKFSNEKARLLADSMLQCYGDAVAFIQLWDANQMATIITNTADNIADGSDIDGRFRVTGAKLNQLYTAATQLKTWFETGPPSRADILRTTAVNGKGRI